LAASLEASARRPVIRGGASFLAVILAGWCAWTPLSAGFSAAFSGLVSAALGDIDFGRGGHAEFFRAERETGTSAERDASWDASVELSVAGAPICRCCSSPPSWRRRRCLSGARRKACCSARRCCC
jgi:hypothetical protein